MRTVMLVDDQDLFRDIARSMLNASPEFRVIAEACDGAEALSTFRSHRPDLVVMDVQMPGMNGLDATRQIVAHHPGATVVLTSMRAEPEYGRAGQEAGALGFIAKRDLSPDAITALFDRRREMAA